MKEYAGNVIVPNYSESSVDVIGDASEVKQLYETKFDFNKIIPMPEPLHIDGNGDEMKCANCKEWTNLKGDSESYEDSQRICGVCKIRSNIGGRIDGDDENEWTSLNEHEKKVAMEWRDKYGTASWYDWSIKNWGTKWPASEYYDENFYQIFGNQDWAYYLLSQIFVVISFFVVWKFSEEFFKNKKFNLLSVLLLEGIYFYNFTTPEFNVNVCLMPFWSLTVLYIWKGYKAVSYTHLTLPTNRE